MRARFAGASKNNGNYTLNLINIKIIYFTKDKLLNYIKYMKYILILPLIGLLIACQTTNSETITVTSSNTYGYVDILKNPKPTDIKIEINLEFPKTKDKAIKFPIMVYVHGSSGPLARHHKWLSLFHEMGIATAYANHFEPRNVSSTVGNQTLVTSAMMTSDALHILNALAKHPRVDPSRIGIMGSSKGGTVAGASAWKPFTAVTGNNRYAVHILLYPACGHYEDKTFTNKPMLIMIGDKDDWTGVAQCVESANDRKKAGYENIEVKLYPDAYHGFDGDKWIGTINNAYSVVGCRFIIKSNGETYEATTGLNLDDPITRKNAFYGCAKKDPVTIGGNHVMPQAMKDVREFLIENLLK